MYTNAAIDAIISTFFTRIILLISWIKHESSRWLYCFALLWNMIYYLFSADCNRSKYNALLTFILSISHWIVLVGEGKLCVKLTSSFLKIIDDGCVRHVWNCDWEKRKPKEFINFRSIFSQNEKSNLNVSQHF